MFRKISAILALLVLAACDEQQVRDFADEAPPLAFIDYFRGERVGHGLFTDRFGIVQARFVVVMRGEVEEGKLVLREDFAYADGTTEQRVWTVEQVGPGRYRATAPDVVGVAEGEAAGSAMRWRYDLLLPVGDDTWQVSADDWMFLQADGEVLLNQATFARWGVEIGRVNIAFR